MNRVLLLISQKENQRLLADWLSARYPVAAPASAAGLREPFDVCILDGPALTQLRDWVRAVKRAEHPAFLPFLLVTNRHDVGLATRQLWESVNELIVGPIEKAELQARVENLLRARQLSRENLALTRQLEAELARAGAVQAALLPRQVPPLPGFELAARCIPAREVGGDFYDWEEVAPGAVTLQVGDVMGKGMQAALLMATARATLRAAARQHPPAKALGLARQALESDLERIGSFVTLFHARLDVGPRRLRYVVAGHTHAFFRRRDGAVEGVGKGSPPLGFPVRKDAPEGEVHFQPGDALVIYSDGLLETRPDASLDRAEIAAALDGAPTAAAMVERLVGLAALTGPPPDDLTVVLLRRTNGSGSPGSAAVPAAF